jgi:hypothetical protein
VQHHWFIIFCAKTNCFSKTNCCNSIEMCLSNPHSPTARQLVSCSFVSTISKSDAKRSSTINQGWIPIEYTGILASKSCGYWPTRHYFLAAWLYVYVSCKISFNHETFDPASMAISKSFSRYFDKNTLNCTRSMVVGRIKINGNCIYLNFQIDIFSTI